MTLSSPSPLQPSALARRSTLHYEGRDHDLGAAHWTALCWMMGAFFIVRLWAMVVVPFTDTTEARYGEMARKMVETGNWITPQFDYGVPFWGKPPLHTWLSAAGMEAFGIHEFAARLPILLTALVVLVLVWRWVSDVAGRNTALVSVAVLTSMGMFFGASAFVMTDMPMVMGTTLVMVGFWNAVCRPTSNRGWGLAVFVGLAIGMLAKGPVAVVICIIPVVIWVPMTGNWRRLGNLPWMSGIALLLVLTVPWYLLAERATPGFLRYFIIGEHIERFLVPGWTGDLYGSGHSRPKGMIWVFWTQAAFPWSLVLLPLALRARRVFGAFRQDRSGWLLYLLAWSIAPMILFTPAANILAAYTLPGLPAAAILLVTLCATVWPHAPRRLGLAGFSLAAAVVFLLFMGISVMATLAPERLRLKSHKTLVEAAHDIAPDATFYRLAGRSYSYEFYTRGGAKSVDLDTLKEIIKHPVDIMVSVPPALGDTVAALDLKQIGQFGRSLLFYKAATQGTE